MTIVSVDYLYHTDFFPLDFLVVDLDCLEEDLRILEGDLDF